MGEEVVEALASMEQPEPMNHGDCFKLRLSEHFTDVTLKFCDPRPYVRKMGLVAAGAEGMPPQLLMGKEGYGLHMKRSEVRSGWSSSLSSTNSAATTSTGSVTVVPIVNVEVFHPNAGGPGIQPHLRSIPEVANTGWRNYGNLSGLRRLVTTFSKLQIPATAVVNSEAVQLPDVAKLL